MFLARARNLKIKVKRKMIHYYHNYFKDNTNKKQKKQKKTKVVQSGAHEEVQIFSRQALKITWEAAITFHVCLISVCHVSNHGSL